MMVIEDIPELPTLYKRTTAGGVQEWQIAVEPNADGSAHIVTTYGLQGGAKQVVRDHIKAGKNVGKKNETSPLQQAILEAKSKHEKQLTRKLYGLEVEASAAARAEAPMLALPFEKHAAKVSWDEAYAQPKLDGYRCLAKKNNGVVTLWSREGKQIKTMEHIITAVAAAMEDGDVFDGELYVHGESFQVLSSWIRKQQSDSAKVQYHVYDQLSNDPFYARYDTLDERLGTYCDTAVVTLVDTKLVVSPEELMRFQASCIEEGYEGAMLRHGTEGYQAGKRAKQLLKVKTFKDEMFTVHGVREGRGTHEGMAVLICAMPDGTEFEVLAPGTHDDKRAVWRNQAQYVGQSVLVKFQELTTSECPVPRFPVAVRFDQGINE